MKRPRCTLRCSNSLLTTAAVLTRSTISPTPIGCGRRTTWLTRPLTAQSPPPNTLPTSTLHAPSALSETSTNTTAPRQSKRRRVSAANAAASAVTDDIARNFMAPTDFPVAAQLTSALRPLTQLAPLLPTQVRKPKRNRNTITPALFTAQLTDTDEPRTLLDDDSVLLSVQVFSANSARLLQTFTVVDSQPLSALSDVIRCPRDAFAGNKTAADTSNVFFIENTLYDDTRAHKHRLSFDILADREEQQRSTTQDDSPLPPPYLQSTSPSRSPRCDCDSARITYIATDETAITQSSSLPCGDTKRHETCNIIRSDRISV